MGESVILFNDPRRCYDVSRGLLLILSSCEMSQDCRNILTEIAESYERAAWELAGYKETRHEDKDVTEERTEGWDYSRLDL